MPGSTADRPHASRKKLAEELREFREEYQSLFNQAGDAIFLLNLDGSYRNFNDTACRIFGYSRAELSKMHFDDLVAPEYRDDSHDKLRELRTGAGFEPYEKVFITKAGARIPVELNVSLVRGSDRKSKYVLSIARDITERKQAEEALRRTEAQVKNLSEQIEQLSLSVADMISAENPQDVFDRISKAIIDYSDFRRVLISYFIDTPPYREILGYAGLDEGAVDRLRNIEIPRSWFAELLEQGRKVGQFSCYVPHTMKDILHQEAVIFGRGPIPASNDAWHPEDNLFVRLCDRDGNLVGVISVDESKSGCRPTAETVRPLEVFSVIISQIIIQKISERRLKELERQFFQAQKMESIGRFAGGIAHDFNNILTGIMGYAELLKMQHEDPSTREGEAADVILRGARRAASLVRRLLGFAREGKHHPTPLNVNQNILETLKISEKIFEMNVRVRTEMEARLDTVEVEANQLDQALTNIFINAKDAMPDGGDLTIRTENIYLLEDSLGRFSQLKPGDYVKISITDTGIGMTKEVCDRIFEPFYTTKEQDQGTGLGLATAYGVVKNHNGHITVYSEPGEGARFCIYLPVSQKEVTREKAVAEILPGDATLLIVDDEEDVRVLARTQLEGLGYEVMIAGDGLEAIDIYSKKWYEIDLVLLDMIMPNLAGRETFWKLREIDPEVKVVLISGFSHDGRAAEILDGGALDFIQKPFRLDELSRVVHDALRS